MSRSAAIGLLLVTVVPSWAQGQDRAASERVPTLRADLRIPMRDGVLLNGIAYLPSSGIGPAPCILVITPYAADGTHDRGVYFAEHDYPFVSVDSRGRGSSGGEFRPFIQEAEDGFDVVEWLARQSYCNGEVGMWGGSYSGYAQWATAKEMPPHLTTIVPTAAPYVGVDTPSLYSIFAPDILQWLLLVDGRSVQWKIYGDQEFWRARTLAWVNSGMPFQDLDKSFGTPSITFHEWLAHRDSQAYWSGYNPSPSQYAALAIPILTITGAYDGNQFGALTHYRNHTAAASPGERRRHYLIIGPWDHAGTRKPRAEVGGVTFGPASLLDLGALQLQWYKWTMQRGEKPTFLQKNVAYYVAGADRWQYADNLDGVTARSTPLYLDSASNPGDVFHSGQLSQHPPTARHRPDQYFYDPADLTMARLAAEIPVGNLVDQSLIYAEGAPHLIYHTQPFARDTMIAGFFELTAWISLDQPDTDFSATVYEIATDGTSIMLSSDSLRARYRDGVASPHLVATKEPLLYHFAHFPFTSRLIRRGSRLRLVLSPLYSVCCDVAFAERNYNTGGDVAAESLRDARVVNVSLFHDSSHQSILCLPMGQVDPQSPPRDAASR